VIAGCRASSNQFLGALIVHAIAAASSAAQYGAWAYLAVLVLMVLSFAVIPAIGAAVVGWASVLASQGKLNIAVVLIVAMLGAEAGGLAGYRIGAQWGRQLLERPGRWQDRRRRVVDGGERIFARWGWLAVFFLSTIVCGMLKMKHSQFVVWNFIDGAVFVLAVGSAAYGAGKVTAGEQDWGSLGPLLGGLAIAAGCAVLAVMYARRRKARRLPARASFGEASRGSR
jgi:membrane protein DedA with SNARE-associated domain